MFCILRVCKECEQENEQKQWQNPKMKLFYILTRLKKTTIKDIYIMNERGVCSPSVCVSVSPRGAWTSCSLSALAAFSHRHVSFFSPLQLIQTTLAFERRRLQNNHPHASGALCRIGAAASLALNVFLFFLKKDTKANLFSCFIIYEETQNGCLPS